VSEKRLNSWNPFDDIASLLSNHPSEMPLDLKIQNDVYNAWIVPESSLTTLGVTEQEKKEYAGILIYKDRIISQELMAAA